MWTCQSKEDKWRACWHVSLTSSSSEQLVGRMVGWAGSDVIFQAVETTVIKGPQKVSGCSQHHPPLSQVPTLCQPGKQRKLDVVQRLKKVEHLGYEKKGDTDICPYLSIRAGVQCSLFSNAMHFLNVLLSQVKLKVVKRCKSEIHQHCGKPKMKHG